MNSLVPMSSITTTSLNIRFTYPPKLKPFFEDTLNELGERYLYYIAKGGRGSGKTDTMGQVTIKDSFLGCGHLVICRNIQKTIDNSTHATIKKWIKRLGLSDLFNIKKTYIENKVSGSECVFYGLSDQTLDNIASIDDAYFAWLDEAHTIPARAWERFYPSIRGYYNDGSPSKIFITYNPHTREDVFHKFFIEQKRQDALVIDINHDDNPWFKYSYTPKIDEQGNQLIDNKSGKPIFLQKRTSLYRQFLSDSDCMPKGYVRHIWEGDFREFNDEQVINIERFGRFDDTQKYQYDYLALSLDTAYSVKESADFSVILVGGGLVDPEEIHILRVMRGKWEFNDLINNLMFAHKWCEEVYGLQPDRILIENKASGQSLIQEMKRLTTLQITKVTPSRDKYARVCEILPFIHQGKLKIPMSNNALNSWIKGFMVECEMFRADDEHEHDDQVDALTQLVSDFINKKPVKWDNIQWS